MPVQSLQDLVSRFDALSAALPGLIVRNTERGALDALALTDARLTNSGTSASGAAFEDYTPEYKNKKTKAGRYRGHVDFQYSGQMLASTTTGFENITPTVESIANGTAKVSFDGRDELTRKKLRGNDAKRPGFMNPSESEMEIVNKAANTNMERDIAGFFQ